MFSHGEKSQKIVDFLHQSNLPIEKDYRTHIHLRNNRMTIYIELNNQETKINIDQFSYDVANRANICKQEFTEIEIESKSSGARIQALLELLKKIFSTLKPSKMSKYDYGVTRFAINEEPLSVRIALSFSQLSTIQKIVTIAGLFSATISVST